LNSGTEIDMTLGWHMAELDGTNYYYKEGGSYNRIWCMSS